MKDRILRNIAITVVCLLGAVGVVLVGLSSWAPAVVATVPGLRDFDTAHRSDRLLAILPSQAAAAVEIRALVNWQSAVP